MLSLPSSLLARILIGVTAVTVPAAGVVTYSHLHGSTSGPDAATAPERTPAPAPSAPSSAPVTPTAPSPLTTPAAPPDTAASPRSTAPSPLSAAFFGRSTAPSPAVPRKVSLPVDAPRAAPVKLPPAPVVAPTPSTPPAPPVVEQPPAPVVAPTPSATPVPPVVEQPPAPSVPAFSAAAVPSDVHAKLVEYASKGLLAYDGNDTFRPEQRISRIDFATVLVDVLDLSPPETVTGSYSDVPTEAFAGPAIDAMTKAGLIKSIDGSRFAPAETINRSELAVLLAKGLNLPSAPPAQPTFTDVPTVNYAYAAIESVAQAGLMSGLSDGEFRPDEAVTRAQLAVTLVRALSLPVDDTVTSPFVDVPDDSYSSLYVVAAVSAGLLRPVDATHFDPTGGVSRAVAALLFTKGLGLPVPSTTSSPFVDVTSQYYAGQAIEAVVDAGLMKPASSDVFNPATILTLPQESTLFDGAMTFAAAGMPAPDPAP